MGFNLSGLLIKGNPDKIMEDFARLSGFQFINRQETYLEKAMYNHHDHESIHLFGTGQGVVLFCSDRFKDDHIMVPLSNGRELVLFALNEISESYYFEKYTNAQLVWQDGAVKENGFRRLGAQLPIQENSDMIFQVFGPLSKEYVGIDVIRADPSYKAWRFTAQKIGGPATPEPEATEPVAAVVAAPVVPEPAVQQPAPVAEVQQPTPVAATPVTPPAPVVTAPPVTEPVETPAYQTAASSPYAPSYSAPVADTTYSGAAYAPASVPEPVTTPAPVPVEAPVYHTAPSAAPSPYAPSYSSPATDNAYAPSAHAPATPAAEPVSSYNASASSSSYSNAYAPSAPAAELASSSAFDSPYAPAASQPPVSAYASSASKEAEPAYTSSYAASSADSAYAPSGYAPAAPASEPAAPSYGASASPSYGSSSGSSFDSPYAPSYASSASASESTSSYAPSYSAPAADNSYSGSSYAPTAAVVEETPASPPPKPSKADLAKFPVLAKEFVEGMFAHKEEGQILHKNGVWLYSFETWLREQEVGVQQIALYCRVMQKATGGKPYAWIKSQTKTQRQVKLILGLILCIAAGVGLSLGLINLLQGMKLAILKPIWPAAVVGVLSLGLVFLVRWIIVSQLPITTFKVSDKDEVTEEVVLKKLNKATKEEAEETETEVYVEESED